MIETIFKGFSNTIDLPSLCLCTCAWDSMYENKWVPSLLQQLHRALQLFFYLESRFMAIQDFLIGDHDKWVTQKVFQH
jgi:hypothetical protein